TADSTRRSAWVRGRHLNAIVMYAITPKADMCSALAHVWAKSGHRRWVEPILILINVSEFRHDRHDCYRKNPGGGVNAQSLSCDKAFSNRSGSRPAGRFYLAVLRRHRHGTTENHHGRVYRRSRWRLWHFDLPGQAISAEHWWRQRRS